jgi:hypothetical protein
MWQPKEDTMARKVSAETRQDLLQAIRERYRGGLKEEKLRILDEFIAVTGYQDRCARKSRIERARRLCVT